MDHKEKIKNFPASPGVYLMKDEKGAVLYIGKAGNLRKRVSSYFYPRRNLSQRIAMMVSRICDISYIPTATEAEALIYESGLIKQLSPKYNVALRDDKSYPILKLTVNENFPRLFITRQRKDDGALYYGPYTSAKLLKAAVIILRQMFPLRSCVKLSKKLCLNYHIKQCRAPCDNRIDEAAYNRIVVELKLFLDGKREELIKLLSERMMNASEAQDFEEAEQIRKRIEALSAVKENAVSYAPAGDTEELKNVLGIQGALENIEAFDVSNIMGQEAVGSMVCFYKGRPKKSAYRKFKIKAISGIDDYAMIREIIRRRYKRALEEGLKTPDLIVVDGGKGHLSAASEELDNLGLSRIPVLGIAKKFEHIYVKDKKDPLVLPKEAKALHLLERIRDEAHRFAISYHKSLRSRSVGISELDRIRGIGEKRKKALLGHFGSIAGIKAATVEDILNVDVMDEATAQNIVRYFRTK